MQVLLNNTKHDLYWYKKIESYYKLTLLKLIEKKILSQTKDQYCYATVYDQECALYGFNQHNLINEQYYSQFNTNVGVVEAIRKTI